MAVVEMNVIKLNRTDISEMVRRAVRSIVNESVSEVMGSAMADKEGAIEDIVNYVKYKWAEIQENVKPIDTGEFGFNDEPGQGGKIDKYIVMIPSQLGEKLGLADEFDINVTIMNFKFDPKFLKYFGGNERGTEGISYNGGGIFNRFNKTTFRMMNGRIDLTVPALNGELQTKDLHATLYHELNHSFTGLELKKKMSTLPDDELDQVNMTTMSQRKGNHPHLRVQKEMSPDFTRSFLNSITYGKYAEDHRAMNFIFYAIWEKTELNARAEAIYGDLKELHATRQNFKDLYPQTAVYRNIDELKTLLDNIKKVPSSSNIWDYAAETMNMKPRGKLTNSFYEKVKERFISRTEELLNTLYKKAMKVAELYFQRHEPKPEPTRLERYKQEHNK